MNFHELLNSLVKRKNKSIRSLAAEANVSFGHLARLLRDPNTGVPTITVLDGLALVLDISFTELFHVAKRLAPICEVPQEPTLFGHKWLSGEEINTLYRSLFHAVAFQDGALKSAELRRHCIAVAFQDEIFEGNEEGRTFVAPEMSDSALMDKYYVNIVSEIEATPEDAVERLLVFFKLTNVDPDEFIYLINGFHPDDFTHNWDAPNLRHKLLKLAAWQKEVSAYLPEGSEAIFDKYLSFWTNHYFAEKKRSAFLSKVKVQSFPDESEVEPKYEVNIHSTGNVTEIVIRLPNDYAGQTTKEILALLNKRLK
ncbi:helix-turn-helix domain-containing protein [Heliorestis convoluta]|uniref:Helix-turn-helix family protein n=1 Tax=Heliorestis convoluta TaxID=356322 RepID=A0A5Q2N5G2_9FIRM|nr:helix-turn-helix transcriptional regulator [Heliorestis convoluta]QGG48866.1 helix-turn-helix family protein [Heliorestis convoluta]